MFLGVGGHVGALGWDWIELKSNSSK